MTARLLILLAALAGGSAQAQNAQHPGHGAAATPYAGLQQREIKVLSAEERAAQRLRDSITAASGAEGKR